MKISFRRRVSGLAKTAYVTETLNVESYQIVHPGELYRGPFDSQARRAIGFVLLTDNGSVYDLKSDVTVLKEK